MGGIPFDRDTRKKGDALPFRKYVYIPDREAALGRVRLVFRTLLYEEQLQEEVLPAWSEVTTAWLQAWPDLDSKSHALAEQFIKTWLLVENPSLARLLFWDYIHETIRTHEPVAYASWRLSVMAKNPLWRGRPSTRQQRSGQTEMRSTERSDPSLRRVDIASLWRQAEVWVRVRHKLEKSLRDFVANQAPRQYTTPDGYRDFESRYRKWKRDLKEFDRALSRHDLMLPQVETLNCDLAILATPFSLLP